MPKPSWDASQTDQSRYAITAREANARRERHISHNSAAAREELAERRRGAPRPRSAALDALDAIGNEPDETESALRELDEVNAQLQRLAADSQGAPAPVLPVLRIAVQPTLTILGSGPPAGAEAEADEAERPPTPPTAGERASAAPWDAAEPPADAPPVVDLEGEIESFRCRTGQRLAGAPPLAALSASALLGEASPARAPPPPRRARAADEARSPPAEAPPARGVLRTPNTPPWRPAGGQKSLKAREPRNVLGREPPLPVPTRELREPRERAPPAPPPAGRAAPDALGLARMQHACGQLTELVAGYEAEREGAAAADGDLAAADGLPALEPSAGARRPATAPARAPPPTASFGACNSQLIELTSKLVGHLRRAEAELRQQASLRTKAEAALESTRATLTRQADLADAELVALRREVRVTKEDHASQLASLAAQLASLQGSRNTEYVRSMVSSLQAPAPPQKAPPLVPRAPVSLAPAAPPAAPALASDAPSLIHRMGSPVRPVAVAPAAPAATPPISSPTAAGAWTLSPSRTSAFDSYEPSPAAAPHAPRAAARVKGHGCGASPPYAVADAVVDSIAASLASGRSATDAVLGSSPFAWVDEAAAPAYATPTYAAEDLGVGYAPAGGADGAPRELAFDEMPSELTASFEDADAPDAPRLPNEVRSANVLEAYYDERAKIAKSLGVKRGVPSLPKSSGSSRHMPRSSKAMRPTQLFVGGAADDEPQPRAALHVY